MGPGRHEYRRRINSDTMSRRSGVKLMSLVTALQKEPLPALIGEAAWRSLRSIRKSSFRFAGPDAACPVSFQPIGYYQLARAATCFPKTPPAKVHVSCEAP